jgi:hypothetical protein
VPASGVKDRRAAAIVPWSILRQSRITAAIAIVFISGI